MSANSPHDNDPGIRLSDLPDEVRRFIAGNIPSVSQLEVLLLLRENRQREWTAEEISRALYAAESGMAEQLNDLVSKGLAYMTQAPNSRFRYRPMEEDDLDKAVGFLAHLYKERRVAVISLIYAEPIDKARSFADAFRIRKEKDA